MAETGHSSGWLTDTEPSTRFPLYTRLNANDVLPDPVTPLGATFAWIPHILPGWAAGYVALDAFAPLELAGEEIPPVAGFFYGYLYINQSNVRIVGERAGIGWQGIDAAFFSPDSPPHESRPDDLNPAVSERMAARTQWALTTTTFPLLEEEHRIADECRAKRPDLAALSPAALVAHARSLMPIERLTWRGETIGSNQASIGPGVLAQLLGETDPTLVVRLIGNAGDVDSAAPSYALWDLSRTVAGDPSLSAEFDGCSVAGEGALAQLLPLLTEKHPAFAAQFAGFLHEFGYRGPSEWDLGSDSWETRPELPLALIDRLRQLPDSASPASRMRDQEGERNEALQQALALLGDNADAVATLHLAAASARRFAGWRERGKTNCIKVLHEARMALYEFGRRLAAEGHLRSPQQVFIALESELDTLVADPAAIGALLEERERQWRQLFGLEIPTWVKAGERLVPVDELARRGDTQHQVAKPGDVLQGVPASAGIARGPARVVRDPGEIAAFQPGEILIAPQTDPSWTPLFMVAGAVVVDVGAMSSHAMIVSRELGIPCAAGVTGATGRIPDGAIVEVNGSTGTVSILES